MKRLILLTVLAVVLLSCGVGTVLILTHVRSSPDIHSIPVYPGATDVRIDGWGNATGSQASFNATMAKMVLGTSADEGSLDFTTKDSPQQVYAFYGSAFANAGWKTYSSSGTTSIAVVGLG